MRRLDGQECRAIAAGVIKVADNLEFSDEGISAPCLPKLRQAVQMQFSGLLLPHEAMMTLSGVCTERDMRIFATHVLRASTTYIEQLTQRIVP